MFRESELVNLLNLVTRKKEVSDKMQKVRNAAEGIVLTWQTRGPNGEKVTEKIELSQFDVTYIRQSLSDQISDINLKMSQIGIEVGI
jgi:hypothetical protein